jgi:hypothetical protein
VERPLGGQLKPVPVVTQPPQPVFSQAPIPLHPNSSFASYVRGQFSAATPSVKLQEMTVVALTSGRAGGYDWQLAAVRGFNWDQRSHKECLVYKTDGPSPSFKHWCLRQSATTAMTFGYGTNNELLWGLLPEGATRVRLQAPGSPTVEIPALKIGPIFRRRFCLAAPTWHIQTVLVLDGHGHQIAHASLP